MKKTLIWIIIAVCAVAAGATAIVFVSKNKASNKNTNGKNNSNEVITTEASNDNKNKCRITFDLNDGDGEIATQTIDKGNKISKPQDPTRDGYILEGWYCMGEKWSFIGYVATEDMVLVANWELVTYDITYTNLHGATNPNTATTYNIESEDIALLDPVRPEYTFDGWYIRNRKVDAIRTGNFGDIELYAKWKASLLNTTKNIAGAGSITEYTDSEIEPDTSITITATTNSGYTFDGWYEGNNKIWDGEEYTFTMPNRDVSYEARWTANDYSISLINSDSTKGTITGSGIYKYNSSVTLSATPTPGYVFDGWYDSKGLVSDKSEYTFAMPDKDIELTARWQWGEFELTLAKNHDEYGTVTGGGTYSFGQSVTIVAETIGDAVFCGWYEGVDFLSSELSYTFDMPSKSVCYTAIWNVFVVNIEHNILNAGETTFDGERVFEPGESVTVNSSLYKGYNWIGWYKDGEKVSSEESYTFTMPNARVDLVATYEVKEEMSNFVFTSNFENCVIDSIIDISVSEIVLPDYVVEFNCGISNCTNLTRFVTGNGLTQLDISFSGITTLEEVVIGNSIEQLTQELFSNCTNLTTLTIGNSVNTIGTRCFYNCSNLRSVVLPDSVTSIGSEVFKGCVRLSNLVIGNGITSITGGMLNGCRGLVSLTIPFVGNREHGSSDIYQYVFGYIFGSTSYIGGTAVEQKYYGTSTSTATTVTYYIPSTLRDVTVTGSDYIPYYAFYSCSSITDITITSSVKTIGNNAFYGCSNLNNTYFDGTLDDWCDITFGTNGNPMSYAANLYFFNENGDTEHNGKRYSKLTNLVIDEDVISMDSTNLAYKNLINVYYNGTIEDWCNITFSSTTSNPMYYATNFYILDNDGVIIYEGKNYSLLTDLTIPNSVTSIGNYQFYGFGCVSSLSLHDNITSIGSYAFSKCNGLLTVTIPSSVTNISTYGFAYCDKMVDLIILGNVGIGSHAFYNCSKLKNVEISSGISFTNSGSGPFSQRYNEFGGCTSLTNVYFDGTIEDWCNISFSAYTSNPMSYASNFYILDAEGEVEYNNNNYSLLTELVVPNEITSIGKYQFYGFSNLTRIVVPNSVQSIGISAFYGCSSLESIVLPFVGNDGVDKSSSSTDSDHINDVFGYIFDYTNTTSTTAVLGATMQYSYSTTSGETATTHYCWYYIPKTLTSVTITNMNSIPIYSFYNCDRITDIILPDNAVTINYNSFYNCSSLVNIVIPANINSSQRAFSECTRLTNVYYKGTIDRWCDISFSNISFWTYQLYGNPMYFASYFYILDENGDVEYGENKYSLLTDVIIPNGQSSIGANDYAYLKNIVNIVIPKSIATINSSAFLECTSLTNVYYDGTIDDWNTITFANNDANPMNYATNLYVLDENGDVEYNGNTYSLVTE